MPQARVAGERVTSPLIHELACVVAPDEVEVAIAWLVVALHHAGPQLPDQQLGVDGVGENVLPSCG